LEEVAQDLEVNVRTLACNVNSPGFVVEGLDRERKLMCVKNNRGAEGCGPRKGRGF